MHTYFRKANELMITIAGNPNTPPEVLHQMATEAEDPALLKKIADNPNVGISTLTWLAAHDCSQVRIAVAENPGCPEVSLWQLAKDPNPDIRYAIAANALIPDAVLKALAGDDNPYVAGRAKVTMSRLSPTAQESLAVESESVGAAKFLHPDQIA